MDVLKELKKYEPRAMHEHQLPVVWTCAKNHLVWDITGKQYIDFTSGIFVTNVGHGMVGDAVINNARRLIHCYTFPNVERLRLAKKLTEMSGFEKAFFLSAGTEATECAIKLMRMYSKKKKIIAIAGAMHGKTMLAEQLRGDYNWAIQDGEVWHLPFPSALPGSMHGKKITKFQQDIYGYPFSDKTAGIMIESYRGWDATFYPKPYIQELCKWAKKRKIMVCFDEIQGGFGRTGKLFAYEHYGVKPDLVCCGKGLGGGLPISAVLGSAKVLDYPDDLSSTHSANPLCCAAALASLNYIEEQKLIQVAKEKGDIFCAQLLKSVKHKCIKEINCQGLLAAIIFKTTDQANRVIERAMHKGLLCVKTGRESIKLGPPLTIPVSAMMDGLKILEEAISEERIGRK